MKFFSFLLAVIFSLSFTVTAFADGVALEEVEAVPAEEGTSAEVTEETVEASSGDEYLDMVLNNMQNDISDLESEVATLSDEVSVLSESSTVSDTTAEAAVSEEETEVNPDLGIDEGTITSVSVYSVSPITPDSTTGLKSVILQLIGDYDPIVVEYEYQNQNSSYSSYLREVYPDYVWCASFVMLALIIYCIFRLGGSLIG